jgi:hypothetical protein
MLTTGCNKADTTDLNYKAAINNHFKASPACIWSQPKKFPVQAAPSDDSKTEGYDALTLLTRTTAEKKVLIIASKQVNNYDLSEKGRTSWTPDSSQPGYGNFCYGNREVTSIDNSTLGTNGAGAKTVAIQSNSSFHGQQGPPPERFESCLHSSWSLRDPVRWA